LQNNISANFSKFRLQNLKSSSAYNWQRETKRKAGFSFWNERTDYTKYITYKHRRFLNFLLTKFEKTISKAYFAKGLKNNPPGPLPRQTFGKTGLYHLT